MARSALTAQTISRAGVKPSYTAVNSDGNYFANNGREFLHVKNGSGSSINATVQTPGTVDGLGISDLIVAVPAGEERMIGPFPSGVYNQTDGTTYVDWSAATSVTAAVLLL
jgi:hypothetical protein